MIISLLIIGDEVLLGQVVDTNSATIARILYDRGMSIAKKWTVADREEEIIRGLEEASRQSDLIITTGGLGPTKDDITKKALAKFMNVDLVFSEKNKNHLSEILSKRNIAVTDLHLEQCYLPANAEILDNQMGTALGLWMMNNGKIIISMPGVPYEMEYIMTHEVMKRLAAYTTVNNLTHQTINTVGMGETEIAAIIEPRMGSLPDSISLAYLPSPGQVKLRLTSLRSDILSAQNQLAHYKNIISECLPKNIIGYGDTSLEREIGNLLRLQKKCLCIAESCTGGYLAHRITSIAGASDYLKSGIVAYRNEVKQNLLNVSKETLDLHGAVSEECVREMARGAIQLFNSDYAIATSGVAGPGGEEHGNPVGTVWIAYGNKNLIKTKEFHFTRDRLRNIEAAAIYAMILFWKFLKESE